MSKYIGYDAIDYRNDKLHDKSSDFLDGVIYMAQRIEEAPSIDIVFCKECKHRKHRPACPNKERPYETTPEMNHCFLREGLKPIVNLNDFCSYGERSE